MSKGRVAGRTGAFLVVALALAGLGYGVTIGLTARGFAAEGCRVAALMYHAVVPDDVPAARYRVQEREFARHMAELADAGGHTPSPDSVAALLHGDAEPVQDHCPFARGAVILTFDMDGPFHDRNLALPHLERHGFIGLYFVPTGAIDQGNAVTARAVRELAGAGMAIGSHTEWHRDMRTEPTDSLITSLGRTQDTLAVLTGQRVSSVAAPGGRYDERVVRDVEAAGFTSFFNSDPCYITMSSSPYRLCRIEIRGDRGMTPAQALDSPARVAIQATNWRVKRFVERVVGQRVFGWLNRFRSRLGGEGY